ncbi:MAG: radical SAM protein [Bacteroidales bacterium]|jgi:radical SAM protein with 4Fe4S-binding SPASM domain|nr:radical SAM protein [Bacteroidales bacterium]
MNKTVLLISIKALQTATPLRVWNLLCLRVSFALSWIFKIHATRRMPAFVSIEPTNVCNLRCPECPTGNRQSRVGKGAISLETVDVIVPQIAPYACFVNVYFQGEPFLNKEFPEIIARISAHNIMTSTSTNAQCIIPETAQKIVQAKLTKLIVSLDGYDQQSYELYRQGGNFETVLRALDYIHEEKLRQKSRYPIVEVQCLLFNHTQYATKEIREIAKQHHADAVVFKRAQFYSAENAHLLPNENKSRYIQKNGILVRKKPLRNRCWKLWSGCVISWQGNVLPCCFDKNHEFSYGNVLQTSLREILRNQKTFGFKKQVHSNRKEIEMCCNCSE